MTPPKVSILTCSHNRPELLRQAVQSLRDQTDPDWEHLIYDDASTDPGVLDTLRWAMEDPRVRVWRDTVNHDQPSALWNFLADRSYGRYLTVLDDDNMKLPYFVEVMSRELDADPSLGIVTCAWRVDRPGETSVDYALNISTSAERLNHLSTCDGGAMLYRRDLFERVGYFSEEFRTSEDWDWLRRAVHVCKIKHLPEAHSTYRSHNGSRMYRSAGLGVVSDMDLLKAKPLTSYFGVNITFPPSSRLTQSQIDVCQSIARAKSPLSWSPPGQDLCIIVSPFQISNEEITAALQGHARVLSLHMEDPYALGTNLDRVRNMLKSGIETWVCTNDAATIPYYQELVGGRIIVCPTLGPDDQIPTATAERDIDVLICGYAYPSRQRFVAELMPQLAGLRKVFVGDGWHQMSLSRWCASPDEISIYSTQPLADTYRMHERAHAVVCMHRIYGDCSDGAVNPANVNRGAMEGYSGARVFLDRSRPMNDFDENDVVWYDNAADLATKLRSFFTGPASHAADHFAMKCRTNLTYRTRLARVINCVRTPRYLAEIP